jgi:methylmalonyl-CoA mutase cobalamin-binding subunit
MRGLIIGASIGNCVHVAGVLNFLKLAEKCGYRTKFLGPAVSITYLLNAVEETNPEMIAVGYRLTPENACNVLKRLKNSVQERGLGSYKFVFGGTLPVTKVAKKVGLFDAVFSGEEEIEEIIAYLEGRNLHSTENEYGDNLLKRLKIKEPYPLIRHHFGLPSLEKTIEGIKKIADSKVLDIISLGPDQNAQESFFRPKEIDEGNKGAGGVPIRTEEDLSLLYSASRRGNFPLMRSYSGTRDIFKMAELLLKTINNAWTAIPLSWYNELDGRGPRKLKDAIKENQQLMLWHAKRDIPVEVNESHQWSLRDAHDTIAVVMAFLAAYNAKKMGVKTYIAQYMFNNPAGTSASMDLAKMLAKKELIDALIDSNFSVLTQVRAGLASFPPDQNMAKGQLAYSTFLGMSLKPDIVHVVSFSEANHVANSNDVIESCRIARQVIKNLVYNYPNIFCSEDIQNRKKELLDEANYLLLIIKNFADNYVNDPWSDSDTLFRSIQSGLIDAPHLKGNSIGAGKLSTRMINGACYAYDYKENKIITEIDRIKKLGIY